MIAKSLLLSQLRATAATGGRGSRIGFRSILRRPIILAILDIVGFSISASVTYYVTNLIIGSLTTSMLNFAATEVKSFIVILPAIILTITLVMGLVLEVSTGSQFASSDTVNWLPVTASEYVAASTISLFAYYSIFPVVALGVTLPLAYLFGSLGAWELAAVLSIFGIISSASILELARAVLNRFSTSFYKRGGRAAVALRALAGVIVIVIFQALFYPSVYEHFLGVITPSFGPTWVVPLLWASVAVIAVIHSNLLVSVLFSILSIAFSLILFSGAVAARSAYWVPMQPSVRISTSAYAPKSGISSRILTPAELALTRKDLRGLVRRREMIRLLALPGVFLVVAFLGSAGSGDFTFFTIYLGIFIASYTTLFFSMSSVGAEGKSILNLYLAPLPTRDFVIGKAVPPVVFGSIFGALFYVAIALIDPRAMIEALLFLVLAFELTVEMSLMGVYFGTRFPNFSESPRASFVSQTGGLIAFPSAILVAGLSISPFLFALFFHPSIQSTLEGFLSALVITAIASYVFYRLSLGSARKLLSQIPIS